MRIRTFVVPLAVLWSSACAGTVPPPRFSALDPADPQAPESAVTRPPSLLVEAYSCPTHATVTAKEAGRCPICGTALVAQQTQPTERKP
jgi:heavy metal-binding protein